MAPILSKHQKIALALTVLSTSGGVKKKKRNSWCKKWLLLRKTLSHANVLRELQPDDFKNFLRKDESQFEHLLTMVTPFIEKEDILMTDTCKQNLKQPLLDKTKNVKLTLTIVASIDYTKWRLKSARPCYTLRCLQYLEWGDRTSGWQNDTAALRQGEQLMQWQSLAIDKCLYGDCSVPSEELSEHNLPNIGNHIYIP
ncbi:unnamed protein product, partial [Brenthis ino]